MKFIEYTNKREPFKDGEESEAIKYLIEKGRLDKDKEGYWSTSTEMINYQKWLFIKWANDVQKLHFANSSLQNN